MFDEYTFDDVHHTPVLLDESLDLLDTTRGGNFIDATFGGGGHTLSMLERSTGCKVCGVDRDLEAIKRAQIVLDKYPERFKFINCEFSKIFQFVNEKFDGILFDFGVSSFQIDDPIRGFSFMSDGPLDMRMSRNSEVSAADVVNACGESDLADIIYYYGNEKKAKRIAENIVKKRKASAIRTTFQLKSIIDEVFGNKKCSKINNATKTFQAFRIYVNNELKEIDSTLMKLPTILKNGARIVTISFHSLEDGIVKRWQKNNPNTIQMINKKVIKPSYNEIRRNARARSAVLRGFTYNE